MVFMRMFDYAKKKEQSYGPLTGKRRFVDGCRSCSGVFSRRGKLGAVAKLEDEKVEAGTDGAGTDSRPGWKR